jgi:hypothetical protein
LDEEAAGCGTDGNETLKPGNQIKAMKINAEWHKKNRMPKNASFEQRVKWHKEHAKNCACRPIPEKLLKEMKVKQ